MCLLIPRDLLLLGVATEENLLNKMYIIKCFKKQIKNRNELICILLMSWHNYLSNKMYN